MCQIVGFLQKITLSSGSCGLERARPLGWSGWDGASDVCAQLYEHGPRATHGGDAGRTLRGLQRLGEEGTAEGRWSPV